MVHLAKAMVFSVVMYGCESWTIKQAECQRTDAFELWCWRRLLRVPWAVRRSNQSILKKISPESIQSSCLVMSDSLQSHGLQPARLPCPSPTPRACSNSCPWSQWCHPTISSSVIPFSFWPSIFPSIKVFSSELALCIRWPKYWSFSFSNGPSNEYSGLISLGLNGLISLKSKGP